MRPVVEQAGSPGRRPFLRFRDGEVSGCNLFALMTPRARAALTYWRLLEAKRKRPWRMAWAVGPFEPNNVDTETIPNLVAKHFDLRPAAIIRDLDLRRPIYQATAAYGHFGRENLDLTWERTNKAEALRKDAGL